MKITESIHNEAILDRATEVGNQSERSHLKLNVWDTTLAVGQLPSSTAVVDVPLELQCLRI